MVVVCVRELADRFELLGLMELLLTFLEGGLVYVSSDPSSAGFTPTGGKVPARYSK